MKIKFMDYYTGELVAEKTMDILPNEKDLVVVNGTPYKIMSEKWFYLDTEDGDFIAILIQKL